MQSPHFKKEILVSLAILVFSFSVSSYIVFAKNAEVVSQWDGDALSGATVSDTQDGNKGTILGGVTVVSDKFGKAFRFNGSSARINMGNPASLNFGTDPFSLEALFNWDGKGSSVNNIIRKSNYPSSGPGSGYWLRIGRDNKTIEFSVGATTGPEGQSLITAPISPGVWHHVVATRDSSDNVKLYVDGESKGTILRQAANAETTSEFPFALGAWEGGSPEYFSGLIKSVSIYQGALDSQEVKIAYSKSQITYPIPELGNCKSESECRAYCEKPENSRACLAFVKEHHLASDEEIAEWEKFIDIAENGGPGGCRGEEECLSYCEDSAHIVECTDFVEKYNLVPPEELAEMRQVATAIKAGAKLPGDCRNKADCLSYCENTSHAEECVAFAEAAGFISKEEAEQAKKFMPLIAKGQTPGGCKSKDQCEAYCSLSNHIEECIAFAEKAGILQGEELEQAKKVAPFLARGETPGGCKSKTECESYCQGEGHFEECIAFGEKTGLIAKEEAEIARKTGGKGPGGCNSRESCESFCSNPANQQTCMDFAKEHGLEAQGGAEFEQKKAEAMQEIQKCAALSVCSEFISCIQGLQAKFGGGGGGEEKQGGLPSDVQAKLNTCIAELQKGAGGGGEQGGPPPGGGASVDRGAEECTKQGGNWDGAKCNFPNQQDRSAEECAKQGGSWDGKQCNFPTQPSPSGGQSQQPPQYDYKQYCPQFESTPSCSYVGSPDSQDYKLCKQCFPNK